MSLFQTIPGGSEGSDRGRPLADRMRPRTLDEFLGQEHLIAPGKPLRAQIERDDIGSLIFWGPPGTGKTTLAKIIASLTRAEFIEFSAVLAGIKEVKQVMGDAEPAPKYGTPPHNKPHHNALLPHDKNTNTPNNTPTTKNPPPKTTPPLPPPSRAYVLQP